MVTVIVCVLPTVPDGQFHDSETGAEFTNSAWVPSVSPAVCAVSVCDPARVLRYLKVTEFVPPVIVMDVIVALSAVSRNTPGAAVLLRPTEVLLAALTGLPPAS